MARWFTSDLHFGHGSIVHAGDRPFPDVHSMDQGIVEALNASVGVDDELWIVGDLALGDPVATLPLLYQVQAATKVLVAGNHDDCHPYAWDGDDDLAALAAEDYRTLAGLAAVHPGTVTATLPGGIPVAVCHFPPASTGDIRFGPDGLDLFTPWRPKDETTWLIHGHVHAEWRQRGRCINVGIDAWGGHPVHEQTLADLVAAGPRDLPAIPWR